MVHFITKENTVANEESELNQKHEYIGGKLGSFTIAQEDQIAEVSDVVVLESISGLDDHPSAHKV